MVDYDRSYQRDAAPAAAAPSTAHQRSTAADGAPSIHLEKKPVAQSLI
jgi:hypothetical protein